MIGTGDTLCGFFDFQHAAKATPKGGFAETVFCQESCEKMIVSEILFSELLMGMSGKSEICDQRTDTAVPENEVGAWEAALCEPVKIEHEEFLNKSGYIAPLPAFNTEGKEIPQSPEKPELQFQIMAKESVLNNAFAAQLQNGKSQAVSFVKEVALETPEKVQAIPIKVTPTFTDIDSIEIQCGKAEGASSPAIEENLIEVSVKPEKSFGAKTVKVFGISAGEASANPDIVVPKQSLGEVSTNESEKGPVRFASYVSNPDSPLSQMEAEKSGEIFDTKLIAKAGDAKCEDSQSNMRSLIGNGSEIKAQNTNTNTNTNAGAEKVVELDIRGKMEEFGRILGEKITENFSHRIKNGVIEARISLNPPELGALNVKFKMEGNRLMLEIIASEKGAFQNLNETSAQLRGALERSGFNLEQISLSLQGSDARGASEWSDRNGCRNLLSEDADSRDSFENEVASEENAPDKASLLNILV